MKRHSHSEIKKIKDLRRQGLSIGKIMHTLHLPKTTVWGHIQGIRLRPEQELLL